MRFLFFIVHPSKYHLFKNTINGLIKNGHKVDVCYSSKDVLDNLVKSESWDYYNLFPKGRNIAGLNRFLNSGYFLFLTIIKLLVFSSNKKYNLFITDDALGIVGKMKRVPTIHFADDDYNILPVTRLLFKYSTYILSPEYTDLGKFKQKKISFLGFKQSAYLRPNQFSPKKEIIGSFNPAYKKYFLIRLVSLRAMHDYRKSGISDSLLMRIISLLKPFGNVYISSERPLPSDLEKYRIRVQSIDILHALAFADLLISDSQSMSLEAAMLGTPFVRFNSFVGKIKVLEIMENFYNLGYGINSQFPDRLIELLQSLISNNNEDHKIRYHHMLNETIDLTEFMIWLFENFPNSIEVCKNKENIHKLI